MKRRKLSAHSSRKIARKGSRVKRKNMMSGSLATMRGGIRL